MIENGYTVINTNGEDLDCDFKNIINQKVDLVTALKSLNICWRHTIF